MNRENINRLAREARGYISELPNGDAWLFDDAALERFAALVAAAERKACAKIADGQLMNQTQLLTNPPQSGAAWTIAAAIRARGQ